MRQRNLKKLILLNLPYFVVGLVATNLGEAWRLATGTDMSEKILHLFGTLPLALGTPWPSLYPLDLAGGGILRCAAPPGGIPARQKRQKIPPQSGVRVGPLECIILSVRELYMDA